MFSFNVLAEKLGGVNDLARFVIASLALVPIAALERREGFNSAKFMAKSILVVYWS